MSDMRAFCFSDFLNRSLFLVGLGLPLLGGAELSAVKVVNALTGKVLDGTHPKESYFEALSSGEDTVRQTKWNGLPGQRWLVEPSKGTNNSAFALVNEGSRVALTEHCTTTDNCRVSQRSLVRGMSQQWEMVPTSDGYMRILSRSSGLALGSVSGSPADHETLQLTAWDQSRSQEWLVEPAGSDATSSGTDPDDEGIAISIPSGSCRYVSGDWGDTSEPSALWHLEQKEDSITGTANLSYSDSCGEMAWKVSGLLSSKGRVDLTAKLTSGSEDLCGHPAPVIGRVLLDLKFPSCSEARVRTQNSNERLSVWKRVDDRKTEQR